MPLAERLFVLRFPGAILGAPPPPPSAARVAAETLQEGERRRERERRREVAQLPLFVLASSLKFAAVESVQPVLANRQPSSVVAPESKLSVPSTTVQPYTAYSHGARSDSIVAIEK